MRIWCLFLLLLVPCMSVEVNKSVTGPQLLDMGQTLKVETVVFADKLTKIDRIEDPLPSSMEVSEYPSGCSAQLNILRCPYGMGVEGKITITYTLTAKSKDKRVPLEQARVYYEEQDIPSTAVSNSIPITYSIGPPELNFTSRRALIDGIEQSEPYMALPESPISFSFGLKNSGAIIAENVTLSLSINQWGISKHEMVAGLQPDEERPVQLSFTAPKNEGSADAEVGVSWTDPILHRYRELTLRIPLSVSRPRVKAERLLELRWMNIEGELTPVIFMQYSLKNSGKLPATVVLEQEVPELLNIEIEPQGVTEGRNTTIRLELDAGESSRVTLQGEATGKEEVVVPASVINYFDSRNYQYETFTWDSEKVQVTQSIWATVYSIIGPFGVMGKLIILALLVIFSVTTYRLYKAGQEKWYIFVIPVAILVFLTASYFMIEGLGWLFEIILAPVYWIIDRVLRLL